jgi:uncharacterized metal-binding protein
MPKYKTHCYFNSLFALPLLILFLYLLKTESKYLAIFSCSFIYSTLFFSPDLDLIHKIKLFSIRGILSLPLIGYSKVFKHRGFSHLIVFGTLSRIVWAALIVFVFLAILLSFERANFIKEGVLNFIKEEKTSFFYLFLALFCADGCHILLDKVKKN